MLWAHRGQVSRNSPVRYTTLASVSPTPSAPAATLPPVRPLIAVFGASAASPGDARYRAAARCGRLLAEAGFDVGTGGYGGLMEAVSRGAGGSGGHVVGVTAPGLFPSRSGANRFVAEERQAASLTDRIGDLLYCSAGAIALEGSLGTFTELLVAWNAAYIDALDGGTAKPVIAVGDAWRDLVARLGEELATNAALVACVPDVESAVAEITRRIPV